MGFAAEQVYNRPIDGAVATAGVNERLTFIKKTYAHLAGAIGLFVLLEYLFITSDLALPWTEWALSGLNWLFVLGLFMVGGWVAQKWAQSDTSRNMQYVGLTLYVGLEALLFAPILFLIAYVLEAPEMIAQSAVITLFVFAGLTGTVYFTKKDFSFLRGVLGMGALAALGMIVASMLFGFTLGTFFSAAMVLLASGYILYYTSQIFAHYRPTQYVAAALALFAAVALLFWYVLRLVMSLSRN